MEMLRVLSDGQNIIASVTMRLVYATINLDKNGLLLNEHDFIVSDSVLTRAIWSTLLWDSLSNQPVRIQHGKYIL